MGRHADRPVRAPAPWGSGLVLGLVAGATAAGVLTWGGARSGAVLATGILVAVGTFAAVLLGSRVPVRPVDPGPGPDPDDGATGPDAVP